MIFPLTGDRDGFMKDDSSALHSSSPCALQPQFLTGPDKYQSVAQGLGTPDVQNCYFSVKDIYIRDLIGKPKL